MTERLPIAAIEYDGQPDGDNVALLVESMREIGQQAPVGVVKEGNGYRIIPGRGRDRVEAASRLGLDSIEAIVMPSATRFDELRAELSAIEEELCRKKMSPADEARLTARRKAIYEELHPETKRGTAGGKARQGSATDSLSFAESQARVTGAVARSIQRAARRGAELGTETLERVARTSLDKGEELDALIDLPPEKREDVIARAVGGDERASAKLALQQHHREMREQAVAAKIMAAPGEKAGVLYVDLPWKTVNWSVQTGSGRAAENHYTTMTLAEIEAFAIDDFAADDCYLLAWATGPFLWEALRIFVQKWGFTYVSRITWGKVRRGTGRVVVDMSEELLILNCGQPVAPAVGKQPLSLYDEPEDVSAVFVDGGLIDILKTGHSEKPEFFAELIEKHWPNTPKRELFARGETRPGWLPKWGYEATDEHRGEEIVEPPAAASSEDGSSDKAPRERGVGAALENGSAATAAPGHDGEADPFAELTFHKKPRPEVVDPVPPSFLVKDPAVRARLEAEEAKGNG